MSGPGAPRPGATQPGPTPAELAAIVAAVEVAWPRAVILPAATGPERPGPWRFSGRWWSKPSAVQRNRPWVDRAS